MSRTAYGLDTTRGDHWSKRGACVGHDPADWETIGSHPTAANQRAKIICRACPVRVHCLRDAQEHPSADTIRGGLTEQERRAALIAHGSDVRRWPDRAKTCARCSKSFTSHHQYAALCDDCRSAINTEAARLRDAKQREATS